MILRKTLLTLALLILAGGIVSAQNFRYIGAPKCKMCHMKPEKGNQWQAWLDGPHSKAMETLSNEQSMKIAKEKGIADPTKDQACVKCHATTGHIDSKLAAGIKQSEGVSCESCHGPGSRYKGASIMRNRELAMRNGLILPTEEVCKECHNPESPTYIPFNYDEKVAIIAHPDPTLR